MKEIQDLQKAISLVEQATEILRKSQMAFDLSGSAHDHHVAYTRTNASGTVSQIQAKGSPKFKPGDTVTHHDGDWKVHEYTKDGNVTLARYSNVMGKDNSHYKNAPESELQAKGAASTLPSNWKEAHDLAEAKSYDAWNGDGPDHDEAEAALMHSAKLHEAAASAATEAGDHSAARHHQMKAKHHYDMAQEHGAESHRMFVNEAAAKQQAATNAKLAAEKKFNEENNLDNPELQNQHKGMTEAEAGTHLSKLLNQSQHERKMVRKAEEWKDAHNEDHSIAAEHVKGTEAREYTHDEVYGNSLSHKKFKSSDGSYGSSPTGTDFSDSFMEKQREANHDPFILKHPNGNRYLVDPQGAGYARYIAKIKEEPKAVAANPHDYSEWEDHVTEEVSKQGGMTRSDAQGVVEVHHMKNKGQLQLNHTNGTSAKDAAKLILANNQPKQTSPIPQTSQSKPKAPTPQTGIPSSRVHVDTGPHRVSHFREPKGRGGWFFSRHKDIDFGVHKEGEDWISTPSMTYTDAKEHAKKWAASKGHSLIYVQP